MAQEIKFYVCKKCGNLVGMVHDSNVSMICCGQEMTELKPNTVEAAKEKHGDENIKCVCVCAECSHL